MELNIKFGRISWKRTCPKCKRILLYKTNEIRKIAIKFGKPCRSCTMFHIMNDEYKKKISNSLKSRTYKKEWNDKKSKSLMGHKVSLETRKKLSDWNMGRKRNYIISENTRMLLRLNAIKRKKNGKFRVFFNKIACEYFDRLGQKNNSKIRHALNGGEFCFRGYFADGYDETTNTWYEWDEKHHYYVNGTLRPCDMIRQKEIEKYLKCKFIRIVEEEMILDR